MGKLMIGVWRFLLVCTLLSPIWLVPTEAFAYGESISVNPPSGPAGKSVTISGSGWYDHARLGYEVPILIGTTEVGRGKPDANGESVRGALSQLRLHRAIT